MINMIATKQLLFKSISMMRAQQMMPAATYMMNPMAMRFFSAAAANQKVMKQQKKDNKKIVNTESVTSNNESNKEAGAVSAEPGAKIVTTYTPKRNAFLKLGYNEHHIPNQCNYEKDRKVKLE